MSVGEALLHALCKEGDTSLLFKFKLTEDLFQGDEKSVYKFVSNHLDKYISLPKLETLLAAYPNLAPSLEPATYYMDQVSERHKYVRLNASLMKCSTLMKDQKVAEALEVVSSLTSELAAFDIRQQMAEFGADAYNMVLGEVARQKKLGSNDAIKFGWPYLDDMVHGLQPGDVVSYVGRPAVGKTWKLIYSSLYAWQQQAKNVMILSMEMNTLSIAQRLASLYSQISIASIKTGFLMSHTGEPEVLESKLKAIHDKPNKLHLIDGNLTSTPQQIFSLAHQLQPDVVFIDGAYLLRSANPRLDRWTRVAENIEEIKRLTSQLAIPTVCSYQFNREASKKKTSDDVTLNDIGYSDAIGQISSVVLGLFEEDSVETLRSRKIRVLKGRDGAIGQFDVRWDFENMDFSQITKEDLEEEEAKPLGHL